MKAGKGKVEWKGENGKEKEGSGRGGYRRGKEKGIREEEEAACLGS